MPLTADDVNNVVSHLRRCSTRVGRGERYDLHAVCLCAGPRCTDDNRSSGSS